MNPHSRIIQALCELQLSEVLQYLRERPAPHPKTRVDLLTHAKAKYKKQQVQSKPKP